MLKKYVFGLCLIVLVAPLLSVNNSGVLPEITQSPRINGLAGSFTALSDDVNALLANPAGLYSVNNIRAQFFYKNHLPGVPLFSMSGIYPVQGVGPLGLNISYLRASDDNIKANEWMIRPSWSYEVFPGLGVGITLSMLGVTLGEVSSMSAGMDLGVRYILELPRTVFPNTLSTGILLKNLGTGLKYADESFPLDKFLRAGLAWAYRENWTMVFEVDKLLGEGGFTSLSVGAEYKWFDVLTLRGGIRKAERLFRFVFGTTLELQMKAMSSSVDYSFEPVTVTGQNIHDIALNLSI